MKKIIIFSVTLLLIIGANAQTNLITNGTFETTPTFSGWSSLTGTDIWGGTTSGGCTAHGGSKYMWMGDQTQQTGINNATQDLYQTVTIPSSATSCIMDFYASINTEESGTSPYDYCCLRLRSTSGTLLTTLGYISNANGDFGIPGCQNWIHFINVIIPSTYFGSTVRVSFEFSTDGSSPTIFRLDDISMMVTTGSPCTYSLSQSAYTCPTTAANTYSNITSVNTQTGCTWTASITSGSSWLSTTSSGTGNGNISISVLQNTSMSSRNGTIDVNGQTLTITQPGSCTYSLSQNNYACPNASANTYSSILLVNTQAGCTWTATVTSGSSWLSTASSGTGSGALSITVLLNTSSSPRSGTIDVNGQTLTVTQPGIVCTYNLGQSSYSCPNALANTYNNVVLVNTQVGCSWTATVTSGGSWMATSSSGTGSGAITIIVLENTSVSIRTGTIDAAGQTLTVAQPGKGTGINEIENASVSILPNPAQSQISILAKQQMTGEDFDITDNLGRTVIYGQIKDLTTTVNLESLKPGIYLFRVKSNALVYKLIKQ
ncbi:MAG: BACON domain-containing protein [Bacteroidia bacterium]